MTALVIGREVTVAGRDADGALLLRVSHGAESYVLEALDSLTVRLED